MNKNVEWTIQAQNSLDHYCDLIKEGSPSNANKVKKEIILTSKRLSKNPSLFQLDEYYPNDPGNIRKYFKWSYRIVYKVTSKKVLVLDVFHTSVESNQK